MKKILTIIIILCFILSTNTYAISDIPDYLNEKFEIENAKDNIEKVSESLDAKNIFSYAFDTLFSVFLSLKDNLLYLILIIFLASVVNVFSQNNAFFSFISLCSAISLCLMIVIPVFDAVEKYIKNYTAFMVGMSSTMSVLLSSSGNTASGLATSSSCAFATTVTQVFSNEIVLPCAKIVTALSVINSISQNINLSGVIGFLKNFCTWFLGVLFAVFGGVHGAIIKLSSSADNLALRGVRFTAARLIPIAGNMISESLKTVLAGMNVIKTSCGGFGIAYIIYTLVPIVFSVLSVKIIILVALFTSKIMGLQMHTSFLDGLNGAINIILSLCLFSAISGIIIFAVFMNTVSQI